MGKTKEMISKACKCCFKSSVEKARQEELIKHQKVEYRMSDLDVITEHSNLKSWLAEDRVLLPVREFGNRIGAEIFGRDMNLLFEEKVERSESLFETILSIKFNPKIDAKALAVRAAESAGTLTNSLYHWEGREYREPACQAATRLVILTLEPCRKFSQNYGQKLHESPQVMERITKPNNLNIEEFWYGRQRVVEFYRFWAYLRICELYVLSNPNKLVAGAMSVCDVPENSYDVSEYMRSPLAQESHSE